MGALLNRGVLAELERTEQMNSDLAAQTRQGPCALGGGTGAAAQSKEPHKRDMHNNRISPDQREDDLVHALRC